MSCFYTGEGQKRYSDQSVNVDIPFSPKSEETFVQQIDNSKSLTFISLVLRKQIRNIER